MTFLPIVDRELRVQARQKRTFRVRLAATGVAIAVVTFRLLIDQGFATPGSLGHGLFTTLAWLAFLYCLLSGAGTTADCLSEEKREGTMGLLFLTDLKGYDVVLGKLLATSLNNFYGLLAIFPPLAITFCLGGVTAGEFWRLVLLLTTVLFFSLSVGMFVSALSRDEQRAWAGALALMAVLGTGPVLSFLSVFDARYGRAPAFFWQSLLAIQCLGWVLLVLASVILPRAWQDRPVSGGRRGEGAGASFLLRDVFPADTRRRRERQQLLLLNPVLWLAERQAGSVQWYLWRVVVLAGGGGLLTAVLALGSGPAMTVLPFCALGLHFLLAVWVAFQASYALAEARTSRTLEMLLSTPLTVRQILEGYSLGLKGLFLGPIATLLAIESAIVLGEVALLGYDDATRFLAVFLLLGAAFCMVMFISDLFAVGRFGLWMGLKSKKPSQAFAKTVLYVLVLPLFSMACCYVFTPLLLLVKNAVLANYAQERLRRHFRTVLAEGGVAKAKGGRLPSVVEPE